MKHRKSINAPLGSHRGFGNNRNVGSEQFSNFSASELYCPTCKASMPVREKLLLTLPSGDLYDYVCRRCGTSVGRKTG